MLLSVEERKEINKEIDRRKASLFQRVQHQEFAKVVKSKELRNALEARLPKVEEGEKKYFCSHK
jgi:hypothetical protein